MIKYTLNNQTFALSYRELREKYNELCSLSDDDFKNRLPEALHLACIICWLKEIPSDYCLSDLGIIHELAHAIHIPEAEILTPAELKQLFKTTLELA